MYLFKETRRNKRNYQRKTCKRVKLIIKNIAGNKGYQLFEGLTTKLT